MNIRTFKRGGVHPRASKLSAGASIERFPLPAEAVIPISQHIGAPGELLVKKGDKVLAGQLLAQAKGFVSANVHSSVSGVVSKIGTAFDALGYARPAVYIKVEGDEWVEGVDRSDTLVKEITLTQEEILERVGAMGIVGMGGATFPSKVKLSLPAGKTAEYLIINGVECEPFLTADHRVMMEHSEELLVGIEILRKALNGPKAIIGIEVNKPDAIERLSSLCKNYEGITVCPLKEKYPQGGEKQLIAAVTGRQVPAGGLPIAVGAVVQNVGTVLAVYEAVQKNKPLVERVVTVTGPNVRKPCNLLVRVGTPVSQLVEYAGGLPEDTARVVSGGPMMGKALRDLSSPVTKGTSGVLLLPDSLAGRKEASNCIRCGKCVEACPMGLEPYLLCRLAKREDLDRMAGDEVMSCIECGSCSFTCPAHIPLLDYIRMGKGMTGAMLRARAKQSK